MTGKMISDLQKQVADLERYIQHMERKKKRDVVSVAVTLEEKEIKRTEMDVEDPQQLIGMLGDIFLAHGYDLDTWKWVLREELTACSLRGD